MAASRLDWRPRIAIIGGGISGLAAAHRLTELLPHAELKLFEASGRLGGVLDTVHRDGFLVERSADSFLTKIPDAVELCNRLGVAGELMPTDESRRRALVVRDGRLLPIPAGFHLMAPRRLWPVLQSPILSLPGKLRLLLEPLVPPGPPAADESVEAFATRRLGREAFERLVQPLVAGIYTGDAAQLSMAATMPEFMTMERQYGSLYRAVHRTRASQIGDRSVPDETLATASASGARYGMFLAPRQGMTSFITTLADRLPSSTVQLGTAVQKIERGASGRWHLLPLPSGEGRGEGELYDAVVVALPAPAAANVLQACDPELAAALAENEYASCTVVSLACKLSQVGQPIDSFGFVVPRMEKRRILAASFASAKYPGRAPADTVLIRVFVGGALQPRLAELPDVEIVQMVREELAPLLHFTSEPLWTDIARWPNSMPQYHVGHLAHVVRIEQLAARHPGLALAGNAYHGVGIPQCIRSGERAAGKIATASRY